MACIFFSIVTCRRVSEVLLLILCKKNGATNTGYLSKASMTGISQEKQPRFDSRLLRSSCWWATKGLDPGIRSQTLGDSPDRFVCLRDLRHLRAVGQLHPVLWDLEKGGEHPKNTDLSDSRKNAFLFCFYSNRRRT